MYIYAYVCILHVSELDDAIKAKMVNKNIIATVVYMWQRERARKKPAFMVLERNI